MKKDILKKAFYYTGDNPAYNIRPNVYILSSEIEREDRDIILDIVFEVSKSVSNDHAYEIVAKACEAITENADDYGGEFCSVYTNDRLAILNATNEEDILEYMQPYRDSEMEGSMLISQACAFFYNNLVVETIEKLQAKITE